MRVGVNAGEVNSPGNARKLSPHRIILVCDALLRGPAVFIFDEFLV
jgi:hypothetical protein